MEEADGEVAVLGTSLVDATAAGTALQRQVASERRRRVVGALRATLEQRAAEARLLLLLQSQRERIDATAKELAAVRRQAAVQQSNPALEAPWLAPPPAPSAEPLPEEPAEEQQPAAVDPHAIDAWKLEWLAAMSHCL